MLACHYVIADRCVFSIFSILQLRVSSHAVLVLDSMLSQYLPILWPVSVCLSASGRCSVETDERIIGATYGTRGTRPLQLRRKLGPSVFGPLQLLRLAVAVISPWLDA